MRPLTTTPESAGLPTKFGSRSQKKSSGGSSLCFGGIFFFIASLVQTLKGAHSLTYGFSSFRPTLSSPSFSRFTPLHRPSSYPGDSATRSLCRKSTDASCLAHCSSFSLPSHHATRSHSLSTSSGCVLAASISSPSGCRSFQDFIDGTGSLPFLSPGSCSDCSAMSSGIFASLPACFWKKSPLRNFLTGVAFSPLSGNIVKTNAVAAVLVAVRCGLRAARTPTIGI
mmetsp:Transcript_27944/g.70693  ORF Transcript_27944/g.70693 Transcript_27944/m.70693 type:complete len:226 (+) Transcript_27944:399-1076(+)